MESYHEYTTTQNRNKLALSVHRIIGKVFESGLEIWYLGRMGEGKMTEKNFFNPTDNVCGFIRKRSAA